MIYKFKSKAAGDVIMLEANGDQVLRIIGKEAGAKGIVTVAELPTAIAALEAAIGRETQPGEGEDEDDAPAAEQRVTLQQRAWPLVDMMKQSLAARADIVWGV